MSAEISSTSHLGNSTEFSAIKSVNGKIFIRRGRREKVKGIKGESDRRKLELTNLPVTEKNR